MKKLTFKSIRSHLAFWFVILGMAPLFIGVLITYNQQVHLIKQQTFDKLVAIRDLKVQEVEKWLDEKESWMKSMSEVKRFRDLEPFFQKKEPTPSNSQVIENTRRLLKRYLANFDDFFEILIINKYSRTIIVSTNHDNEGIDESEDPSLTEFLAINKFHIKDIHLSHFYNVPAMAFAIPFRCAQHNGKHIIGIVVARVQLKKSLYALLSNRTGLGETGETLIVNKDVIALNELRNHENAHLRYKLEGIPSIKASQGESGIAETIAYNGKKILAAYTYIPRTGWGFAAQQELSELYAPIKSMMVNFIILIIVALIAILATAFLTARTIATPVIEMAATAEKMQKGDLSARNHIAGSNELAVLAKTFNTMAESIESLVKLREINEDISETMVTANDLPKYRKVLLEKLVEVTNSQLGAYFLLNQSDSIFEPFTSIGVTPGLLKPFAASALEGELGMIVKTKRITHIRDIPEDTIFKFRTFTGTIIPREIIGIPLIVDDVVLGIVSLASIKPYPQKVLDILKQPWTIGLGQVLSNLRANAKTKKLATQLEETNRGLQAQTEELQAQSEELQAQSEELHQTSEELQEQNQELEVQRLRVEEANRLKSEFLSNMSHELRTPLNSVMALSRVLLMQAKDKLSDEEANYLEIIERNGKNLLSLINNILDLSKIEAGRMDINPKSFPLNSTIETIMERLEPLAKNKGIQLNQNIPDNFPRIESDEVRAHQILQNIIGNAIKFTEQGSVTVSAHSDAENVHIEISDTGIGISEKDLPHIFEEFRQVDGSSARAYEGTGLGLAIAGKAVRMLGGDISVESALGKGSIFTIILPVRWQGEIPASEPATFKKSTGIAAGATNDTGKPVNRDLLVKSLAGIEKRKNGTKAEAGESTDRILLVEDSEAAIIQVKSVLEGSGYMVDVVRGGREAIDYMSHTIPDGIILDLMMPEIDGFQVLDKMRSTEATARVPVLVLTARDLTSEDLGKLSSNNIQQLIQKGDVDRKNLLFKIRLMLGAEPRIKFESGKPGSEQPETGMQQKETGAEKREKGNRKPETILVVEDNPDNMITIKAVLQNKYNILEATNGEAGLKKILTESPDLVLLDMSLPGMDGFTVAGKVKADKKAAHIPVIALTAHAMKSDREKILDAGCDDYISKPIDPVTIREKIQRYLRK